MKGDITINVLISGLFAIGVAAFGFLFFLKTIQEIQTLNTQAQTERDAMHLANALISHEKLIYEKDGVRYRGILNATKLDNLFFKSDGDDTEKKNYFLSMFNHNSWITSEKLDLSFPNALSIIMIVDLDDCNQDRCVVWSGISVSVSKDVLLNTPSRKLVDCLVRDFDKSWGHAEKMMIGCAGTAAAGAAIGVWALGIGAPVGAAIGCGVGIISTLWTPDELSNCIKRSFPEYVKQYFESGSPIAQRGIPVNIIYDDGRIHKGRLIVNLLELI